MLVHKITVWLNQFKKRPNVRRSAWISRHSVVPDSCVIGERVKIKHKVIMGENCFVNDDCFFGGFISIGKGCRIETKVKISSCNTHGNETEFYKDKPLFPENGCVNGSKDLPISIGDYVLIGDHCFITKGIVIGSKAVITSGSVVYSNVPPYAIVRGNPAKIIGYRKIFKGEK